MSNDLKRDAMPDQNCWASKSSKLPGATANASQNPSGTGSSNRGELIAKIGTVVSAIMASSCCWLPLLLLAVGVSGAGIATALEAYRPIFMVVTFGFLGMAFYFTYRPRRAAGGSAPADCCATQTVQPAGKRRLNMMTMNKVMLWGVTVLAIVFLFFPQYVTRFFDTGSEEITANMTRTELKVEGMTCEGWRVKAAQAIRQAPGVLAVSVDYKKGLATIGTERDRDVPRDRILESLESIGYRGEFVK